MKTYVTFGQSHNHMVNGVLLDHNSVAVIKCSSFENGVKQAQSMFGNQFSRCFHDGNLDFKSLEHYPRGLINIDL